MLGVLASIKAQNEQIILLLKKDPTQDAAPPLKPNIKLPIETSEDISEIETFLQDEDNSKLLVLKTFFYIFIQARLTNINVQEFHSSFLPS